MPLSMLKAAKVKFCYLQGMQNPWRSPSYCWPGGSSLGRVEMTCSWCCVSCWKLELAETAVLLPHGEEQCQFPTEISSLWNGYSPMGKSGSGPESGNVQCWLRWKSEINVPIHIWVRKKKQGKLFFLRQLKTSTKWFKGEGNCTVPLSALFLRNLFLPANRTVSVGHIGRPVLYQKYTVHSEVESLKTTLPWNPNVVLWVVFLLSTWWVADLTYATSSLSNID